MKVVHLIESLARAGAERVALEVAVGMRAAGHDASIVALQATDEYPDYTTVPRTFLLPAAEYSWPRSLPRLALRLRRLLREVQPDCVEVHSPRAAVVLALAGARTRRLQVLHGHDICWRPHHNPRRRASLALQRWVTRRMDLGLIAVSREIATSAREILGCPPRAVSCVPNAVDCGRYFFVQRQPAMDAVVGIVGRLIPAKKLDAALVAFQSLRKICPGVSLWIIGDGPMQAELESQARELGLNDSVRFWGRQQNIPELLARVHLLWHFSGGEGLPVVCLEAMASGLPIVATAVTGNREVVQDGRTGWLVPSGEPAEFATISSQFLGASRMYQEFAVAARRRAEEQYSLPTMIAGHLRALAASAAPS